MVLVVGGAGYVGSMLVRELLNKGYAVRIFDKFYYGEKSIEDVKDRIEIIRGDMRSMDLSVFEGVNAVINVGGLSNDPTAEYNPRANYEMNVVATETLAKLSKKRGIKRFLFASSCSIYDLGFAGEDVVQDEEAKVNPKAAYSISKYDAERILLKMVDEDFCPVILRKGTIFGFSYRMRYDLVVNTFVKDALTKGKITIFRGGEMWRPLVDISDVVRAYLSCLEAPEDKVKGQIFNVSHNNYRISELAYRVREALREIGVKADIEVDYTPQNVRSYRVSTRKIESVLDFHTTCEVEDSTKDMVKMINKHAYTDFLNPRYYNIQWMTLLEETEEILKKLGSIF